jgi:hypothetical protein
MEYQVTLILFASFAVFVALAGTGGAALVIRDSIRRPGR